MEQLKKEWNINALCLYVNCLPRIIDIEETEKATALPSEVITENESTNHFQKEHENILCRTNTWLDTFAEHKRNLTSS